MDSGNSGSLQSSSGGDDEFDSRGVGGGVDSSPLSALLRPAPSPSAAAFSLYGLQEFAPPQQQAGIWSGSFTSAAGASSSSSPRASGGADQGGARQQQQQQQQQAEATSAAAAQGSAQPPLQPPPPRGSRKRTRASRRAPTTVLTTDTSNFRAMVQEFTGIPSPPFAAAPAALRTRFDHIFPPPSSLLRSVAGAGSDASLPPYLLRPFAQKIPSAAPSAFPQFTSPSSSSPLSSSSIGVANANAAPGGAATTAPGPSSSNPAADTFQLTSSALLRLQQDPTSYLSFQNLLDSQASSHSIFGAAGGGFAQHQRLHDPSPSSEFLAGIGGSGSLGLAHGGLVMGSEGLQHLHHHQSRSDVHQHGGDELSGVVASGGSCKPRNYSTHAGAGTSSSGAAASGDKPPDAGGAAGPARPGRGEGLDPWICTSE